MLRFSSLLIFTCISIGVFAQKNTNELTCDDIIELINSKQTADIYDDLNAYYRQEKAKGEDSLLIYNMHRIVNAFEDNENFYFAIQWLYTIKDSLCNNRVGECLNIRREIGEFYSRIGDYQEVINNHLENLSVLKVANSESLAYDQTLQSIAYNHYLLENYDSTEYYYKLSLDLALKQTESRRIVNAYNSLGFFYSQRDMFLESEYYFTKGIDYLSQKDALNKVEIVQMALLKGNLGALYIKSDEVKKAIPLLTEDYEVNFKYGNDQLAINAIVSISTYYLNHNQPESAVQLLTKSLRLTKLDRTNPSLIPIYELLFKAHLNLGNSTLSNEYYQLFDSLNTVVYEKDQEVRREIEKGLLRNILESQLRYQENMARVQLEKNEVLEQKNYYYALRFWILGGAVVFVLIIGVYTVKRRLTLFKVRNELAENNLRLEKLENEKINLEIAFKNKDLTNFAIDLSRKQEVLQHVKENLEEMKKVHWDRDELNQKIKDLTLYASNNMIVDNQLQEFQTNIETVNAKFFDALKKEFPSLTELDTQICALIRLGLSNKEIAIMRNVSYKAIRMSRYRIRKKINLEADEDMIEFLKSY